MPTPAELAAAGESGDYYGWRITGVGTLSNTLQGGLIFWPLGIYVATFVDAFSATRASIALIDTFLIVVVNLLSVFVGLWIDRGSVRTIFTLGIVALGVSFLVLSQATAVWHLWAVFAVLVPFSALAIGANPISALISRWFKHRRGLALGLALTGTSIGGMVGPPLVTWLFSSFGWRSGFIALGLAVIALAPVAYKVIVDYPPARAPGSDDEVDDPDHAVWTIPTLLCTRAFWLQTLISATMLCVTLGFLVNLGLHAGDLGITGQRVALLYTVLAACSLIGKVSFGWLLDRFGMKAVGFAAQALIALNMLILMNFDSYTALLAGCIVGGFGTGGVAPLWSTMVADGFGARSFGRTWGLQNPLHIPITAPSAPLAAWISQTRGSYDLVFMIYIGLLIVAAIALAALSKPSLPQPRNASQ
ncbi:MAG: MFS transporter [Pseudomonadota bacterium]